MPHCIIVEDDFELIPDHCLVIYCLVIPLHRHGRIRILSWEKRGLQDSLVPILQITHTICFSPCDKHAHKFINMFVFTHSMNIFNNYDRSTVLYN